VTEVASVASFYTMLYTQPIGRHIVRVCTNLTCHLCGAGAVLERLRRRLGIRPGQTTPDGGVTLEIAECLAACEEAPVLLVDADRLARVTPDAVDDLLQRLRAGGPPAGGRPGRCEMKADA
jgi:NADH-quinone oxidoreductase subunit E